MTKKRVRPAKKAPSKEIRVTKEQAAKALEEERKERVATVEAGIQELLQKHNCSIDLQMTFSANRGILGGSLVVIPLADQPEE